ncbi:unnamed protein product [Penicillium salamii]|uniref:NB-ARC domain-containing protein n=1 Tax=Penicillium salamii TaxID=1612424 RepID=A0A9W4N3K4_9EURO|nr:unnamed protein product [Penicillium salamii]CAG7990580.1 unnamed protein product [Penicillium salamii]CAG7998732.1 unnamed protein product [Penicillium salamii]CAG8251836.1 unnamed protein product [Penicillium salamii]CAG8264439.1 unnamed protein product [Penicillium salamii]
MMNGPRPPIKQFGLTQIYTPRDDPTIDIVFVHGLNGHPQNSWTSKVTGCFWPVDLLPDILAAQRPRILTYGYNANVTAFTDGVSRDTVVSHAETLASSLAANRNLRNATNRPIVFICHSLGGLVVKRALIYSRSLSNEKTEHLRSVYVSTFGILFLGTPHNGSDIAKWGLLLNNICNAVLPKKFLETSPQLVKTLRANNETLQHINSLFVDIMGRFHIYFFHETRSTDVRGTREVIVDEHSAAPYMDGVERMGIEADHSHMCKFDDDNAAGYEAVAEAILRYSRQAPTVISARWIEERNVRTQEKKAKAREIYDEEPINQSMPDLNRVGRATHFLPGPEASVTLRDYEIEEPPVEGSFRRQSVPTLPRAPASEGRNSPVSELGNSGLLQLSHYSNNGNVPPFFVAPPGFHPNATFFGMQKELEILHNRLFRTSARAKRTMAILISGVPGSGKTHLARQYVFTQRDCYPGGIFWIDSKSREASYKCFWEIAQAASLIEKRESTDVDLNPAQTYVNEVRNWLQNRQDWLLVFDGITFSDENEINLFRNFLPWNRNCSIIYTSVDTTLRKKQRLYEPYCLMIPRLHVEDACKLLFKDLGITRPTPEQVVKATRIVEYYECLPLAIHAIGHRLNATGKPIEKYHVKSQVTDKKLAEPFLSIMNDLFRLKQEQALRLINLLSFLGHQVPVGLLDLGRSVMTEENLEIQTSARTGDVPDLDTTLGTLIHYGLIERTSDADVLQQRSSMHSSDSDAKNIPDLSDSLTESSQEEFFSNYRHNSAVDVIKIHSVVQGFCRDELRIQDEELKGVLRKGEDGYFDMWLMTATMFLLKSYEIAVERMDTYPDCGLVRDYREYETHASRLAELYPKKALMGFHSPRLKKTREQLRQLMKKISKRIQDISPSSSQDLIQHQKSVFDRSSSSSSSYRESSAGGGLSRRSTFNFSDMGTPRAESPEQMIVRPRFKLELFPPHIYRQTGYESEEGYETDGEAKGGLQISPALSQASQTTEKPKMSPPSTNPPGLSAKWGWHKANRAQEQRRPSQGNSKKRANSPIKVSHRFRDTKADTPLAEVSSVQGLGSSSRTPFSDTRRFSTSASEAEKALAAVRRSSRSQAAEPQLPTITPPMDREIMPGLPRLENVAARRISEVEATVKRPSSVPVSRAMDHSSGLPMKSSIESLDGRAGYAFASPLSHEWTTRELMEPISRLTYSESGIEGFSNAINDADFHTAPGSRAPSRRASIAQLEPPRSLSASVPTLIPFPPPLPYDEDISITRPRRRRSSQLASGSATPSHPSVIMPGALPLPSDTHLPVGSAPERPMPGSMTRGSSAFSHQSWATEPVRYPPRFSPLPSFTQHPEPVPGGLLNAEQQQQMLAGGSWTSDLSMSSALQSEPVYPNPPQHRRLSSMDERVKFMDPDWDTEFETSQYLHFGAHRVDVRDPHLRLHESTRLQASHPGPQYQLYHPNLSGPLIQHDGHIYAPAHPVEAYGARPRSGSSPTRPNYAGLGVRF